MSIERRFVCVVILALLTKAGVNLPADAGVLTNPVPVTKTLYFKLRGASGPPTNQFPANEVIYCEIGSHEVASFTNNESFYRAFPPNESLVFRLFDQAGAEGPKTRLGRDYSKSLLVPQSMAKAAELHGHSLDSTHAAIYPLFYVAPRAFSTEQMFVLTNSGSYELEVRIRIWAQTTNRGTPIEITGYSNPSIGTNYQFGMVTSPPVRVRIVKQAEGSP
jgi:hypothetical protein